MLSGGVVLVSPNACRLVHEQRRGYCKFNRLRSDIMSRSLRAPFPFVPLDRTELHVEASSTWKRLLEDIASARHEVLFENYIFVDGAAADALLHAFQAAAANGAQLKVLVDGAGSHAMSEDLRQRLAVVAEFRVFHPLRWTDLFLNFRKRIMTRTHRRIVLIDGAIAWTGGLAICDAWWPQGNTPNRETMLRLTGAIVGQFQTAYFSLWNAGSAPLPPSRTQRPPHSHEQRLLPQKAIALSCFRRTLRSRIGKARHRAWIATAYFIPPLRLRRALRFAAGRGVDVRLLLPGPNLHDHPAVRLASRRYYAKLLKNGVRLFEYQPSFQHAKAAVFDDEWTLIGTPNLDRWSYLANYEIAVDSKDVPLASQLHEAFERDFEACREITWEMWKARPLWSRFQESFFGIFDQAF
jgi:phosphatidylserine/phosphatidylglycerophosphate/cardiolipin synthase-like enzyme